MSTTQDTFKPKAYWPFIFLAALGSTLVIVMLVSSSACADCERVCNPCGLGGMCCSWECGAATAYPTGGPPAGTPIPPTATRRPAPTPTPCAPGDPNCRQPCIVPPGVGSGGINQQNCNNGWGTSLNVRAQIPIMNVTRWPWPRGLVTLNNHFWYEGGNESGAWSLWVLPTDTCPGEECDGPADPNWRGWVNIRLGLRWLRLRPGLEGIAAGPWPEHWIEWNFDERAWNLGQDYGRGAVQGAQYNTEHAIHAYETASAGKTVNGVNFGCRRYFRPGVATEDLQIPGGGTQRVTCEEDLPAYQVTLITRWAAQWAFEYDKWQVNGRTFDHCEHRIGSGCRDRRCGDGVAPVDWCPVDRDVYGWSQYRVNGTGACSVVRRDDDNKPERIDCSKPVGWTTFDLTAYGNPTWYTDWSPVEARGLIDVDEATAMTYVPGYNTPPPGGSFSSPSARVHGAIPVPVIEVQSVVGP
jgi:hypothetical protein